MLKPFCVLFVTLFVSQVPVKKEQTDAEDKATAFKQKLGNRTLHILMSSSSEKEQTMEKNAHQCQRRAGRSPCKRICRGAHPPVKAPTAIRWMLLPTILPSPDPMKHFPDEGDLLS